MSSVLTVNAGSTSLKLCLVEGEESRPVDGFEPADAVGHRVVHGGARYTEPVLIDDRVEEAIDELSRIAPLHNTPALRAIREARAALPDVPHVAVFDTAFHSTIPADGVDVRDPAGAGATGACAATGSTGSPCSRSSRSSTPRGSSPATWAAAAR